MTKMSDVVRMPNGEVGTLASFADRGLINFVYCEHFGRSYKPAYFADPVDSPNSGWRIGKMAYLSRTKTLDIEKEMA